MNYIFFGTPRFAEIVLKELIRANMPPIAIVANPDRPVGRKKIMTAPPTKHLATRHSPLATGKEKIQVFQPEKFDENFVKEIKNLLPDFFVVAAYAKILPKEILDIPRLGTLGVHPSLLPKYRGASPIQSAILAGETKTGAAIYLMDEKMDHGPILAQQELDSSKIEGQSPVFELPYLELEEKLAKLGAELLIKTIPEFITGKIKPQAQDESQATYTKKLRAEDGFVDAEDLGAAERGDAEKSNIILRKMNALNPEPGAWTMKDGKRMKLLKAKIDGGRLVLFETQKEGEKPKTTTRIL